MELGDGLHLLELDSQFLFLRFLVFELLAIKFHVKFFELGVHHVRGDVGSVFLHLDDLFVGETLDSGQIGELEELYRLNFIVELHTFAFFSLGW